MDKIRINLTSAQDIPQVLFVGNGLIRACGGNSWDELLQSITCRPDLPNNLTSTMPLRAILITGNRVRDMLKGNRLLYGKELPEDKDDLVKELLGGGFDHILTTNYSYEIEVTACPSSLRSDRHIAKLMKNVSPNGQADKKYLLSTYNEVDYQGVQNRIWHIHGEARKTNSIVLDHNAYAVLLGKFVQYLTADGRRYIRAKEQNKDLGMNSWLDVFMTGDIYFLGFGLDYSEIDIWWLIEKKARERGNMGKIHYFDIGTVEFNEKHELLKALGCEVHNCGFVQGYGTKIDYWEFYKSAISEIGALRKARVSVPIHA